MSLIPADNQMIPSFQLRVPQNLPQEITIILEIVKRILPLGFLYTPKWVFYTVPGTNFVMTLIDKGTVGDKVWNCTQHVVIGGAASLVSAELGAVASFCFYPFNTLYGLVKSIFVKSPWAVEDAIVRNIDIALHLSSLTLHAEIKRIVAVALFFHGFHHGYNAGRALQKATTVLSLETLECAVQVWMSVVRFCQANQAWKRR
jgi:hypothetical protein